MEIPAATPHAGGLIVAFSTFRAATNYSALTGTDSQIINNLIWVVPIVAVTGFVYAIQFRQPAFTIWDGCGEMPWPAGKHERRPERWIRPDGAPPVAPRKAGRHGLRRRER